MSKTLKILAALAAAQLILVAMLWMRGGELGGPAPGVALLAFEPDAIDHIVIADGDQQVTLERKDGAWRTGDGFPADRHKIQRLLDKLAALKAALPVATSKDALARFKLTDDDFERKIALGSSGNDIATLYLGNGAGARKTHARRGDDSRVFPIALGAYDAPAKTDDWQDKTLLQLKKADIQRLEADGLTLTRDDTAKSGPEQLSIWKSEQPLPTGKIVNQKTVNALLGKLASLRFEQVLGKENLPEYHLDKPDFTLSVGHKNGQRVYRFGKRDKLDLWVLKVSDREEYFQLPGYSVDPIKENIGENAWLMDKPQEQREENGAQADRKSTPPDGAKPQTNR